MLSGEYRRSPRIVELDARKAQARSQNKGTVIYEVSDEEDLDKGQDVLKQKRGRKKVKVRTVQDLVVNSVEYEVQKTDTGNDEDGLVNAAIVPSGAALPEKRKLKQLLDILRRRDTHEIFQEPVNPDKVDRYYDIIKEPMDLGTVAKKLNEGSYQTLEEFEHDVFLVPNNAMLFNASSTVYYRQARALRELATRLFHALKTNPENFEAEAVRLGRRKKAGVRILKNKTNTSIAQRGNKAQERHYDVDGERRQSYRPRKSFLSENGSLVSAVYNSSKQLDLVNNVSGGYIESLKRFSEDLGPIAQKVARKKAESCMSEAMRVWITTTNRQSWSPNMQIPKATFASNIKVAPSIQVPSSIPGLQNILGDKMNNHSGFSNGGKASMDARMTINNAFTGGISQAGGRVESPGHFQGNINPSASSGFAPSLHLLGNSKGYQTFAGETMDSPSFFWNGRKVSAVNNVNADDALNKGRALLGDEWGFQEKAFQPLRVAWDGDASFRGYAVDNSNEVHLDSSFPYNVDMNVALLRGKLGNGVNIQEKMLQPTRMDWDNGAAFKDYTTYRSNGVHLDSSFPNNVEKNSALNKGKGKLGDEMDFPEEMLPPARVGLNGGVAFKDYAAIRSNGVHLDSLFPNNVDTIDALNKYEGKLGDGIDFQENMLQPMRVGVDLDGGAASKDYDANQSNGVHLDFSFPNYDSGKAKLDFSALWNTKGKQKELDETSMMVNPINVDNTVQKAGHASLWCRMQESMPKSNGGAASSSWRPSSRVMTGLNGTQTIDYMSGICSHHTGEGMWGKQVIAAGGEGSSYRTNVDQGGVVSDFSKPPEMGVQPSSEFFFQDGTISAELASFLQAKGELDSLCEATTNEDRFGFSSQENAMGASQKFQPESSGGARSRRWRVQIWPDGGGYKSRDRIKLQMHVCRA